MAHLELSDSAPEVNRLLGRPLLGAAPRRDGHVANGVRRVHDDMARVRSVRAHRGVELALVPARVRAPRDPDTKSKASQKEEYEDWRAAPDELLPRGPQHAICGPERGGPEEPEAGAEVHGIDARRRRSRRVEPAECARIEHRVRIEEHVDVRAAEPAGAARAGGGGGL